MGKVKGPHHRGTFHVRSARVRAAAYGDPATTCWRCGLTLDQKRITKPRDKWTAGHLIAGDPDSPLLPEHASCNYSHGAALGNRLRGRYRPQPPPFPRSRDW
jgi:hypothetical protein